VLKAVYNFIILSIPVGVFMAHTVAEVIGPSRTPGATWDQLLTSLGTVLTPVAVTVALLVLVASSYNVCGVCSRPSCRPRGARIVDSLKAMVFVGGAFCLVSVVRLPWRVCRVSCRRCHVLTHVAVLGVDAAPHRPL